MKKLALFAALWLAVGFSTGTAMLLGPVRAVVQLARNRGFDAGAEQVAVLPLIGIFVVGSAVLAFWLTAIVLRTERTDVRLAVPALCVAAAGGTLWLWMSPERMGLGLGGEERVSASFTFGPYPTEERMRELSREGYTAIVSLLHPVVVPFEPKLIAEGRAAAARAGIGYLNVPMLPWVSDNTEALARIERLARVAGGRRYYVHCYLGRDRVRVVKRLIEDADAGDAALAAGRRLERGAVEEVDDGIYLTPYPSDSEYMKFILPGAHGHVVSLLDPEREEDRPWIERERELLVGNRVRFELRPLPLEQFDPEHALAVAREAARMPRPFVVHAFLGIDSGRSPAAEAFLQAFRSGLPPLPPGLFVEPLAAGAVRVIAPNVAVGPQPARAEFALLFDRGVREVVHVGLGDVDRAACESAGIGWRTAEPDLPALRSLLARAGPWYLYGPGVAALEAALADALGPAIPAAPLAATLPPDAPPPPAGAVAFLESIVPAPRTVALLGPTLLVVTLLAAGLAAWLRTARGLAAPYTRKVFHFVIFTAAGVLHLAAGLAAVALFGAIVSGLVVYAVWRGDGFPLFEALARPSDAPRRALFVIVPLVTTALGGLAANLLFGGSASIGYLVAGWGDAIAEPVGTRFGRHRYRVPSIAGVRATRSLEGSAAVLLVGSLAALVGLALSGAPLGSALGVAAACGVAGAAVEAVSNHGLDNLTVQLAASGTAYWLSA